MTTSLRILVTALALTIGSTGLAAPAHGAAGFGDVDAGTWYTEPIAWLVSENITNGTEPGCFSPHASVTRGQIIAFLYRLDAARGNDPESADHPFADVTAPYQQVPVGWAFANDVTRGTTETSFAPHADVTRGDFAVLLWRYAGRPSASQPHPFVDVSRAYQQDAISWMAEEGITTGTSPTTFHPENTMTRAEAATFLYRFMGGPGTAGSSLSASASCLEPLRSLLESNGMTADEAACAAPHLVDFDVEYLIRVLDGAEPLSGDIIGVVAEIASACIPFHRLAVVIRFFI